MICSNPMTSTYFRDVVLPGLRRVQGLLDREALDLFCINDGARILACRGKFSPTFLHEVDPSTIVFMHEVDARHVVDVSNAIPGPKLRAQQVGDFLSELIATTQRLIAALPACECDHRAVDVQPETLTAIHAAMTKQ